MPAKKTAKKAAKKAAGSAAPEAAATDEPTEAAAADEPAATTAETEQVPLNRAERRARGKGGAAAQPTSRGKVVGGKGPASTQRMWANRRSG
jgi:hypothetical protein